jgi:hypothetical protein
VGQEGQADEAGVEADRQFAEAALEQYTYKQVDAGPEEVSSPPR